MRYIVILLIVTIAGLGWGACGNGLGEWCQQYVDKYEECIPGFCQGKTCRLCQCWNDGYKAWAVEEDICVPIREADCEVAVSMFDCPTIKYAYEYVCE
jgi:hypothetical protein